ncbi:MAG: serine/threonine-protein kinase [Desulfobulbus sp.]|nr:serine/threonine-protein kinase [Desulfobulbus sp.]
MVAYTGVTALPEQAARNLANHRVTRSLRRPSRVYTDTTDFTSIDYGDVISVEGRHFLITSYTKEGRFGVDEQIKPWVPKVVDLDSMEHYILKLEFQETFAIRLGQFAVTCYRSPQKEARVLELVRGRAHFMQGRTLVDTVGNLVRVLEPVSGNRLDKVIHTDSSHEQYFTHELPDILSQFIGCLQGIAFLHEHGFRHGDIRRDHVFVDRNTGLYYWIDFDYDFYLPEKPFALDLYELGNILIYLVGRGDYHLREILADPSFGSPVAESLNAGDFSLLSKHRVVNLHKLFPYIPDTLNNILLHFSSGADIFYESVEEIQNDLEIALKHWGR